MTKERQNEWDDGCGCENEEYEVYGEYEECEECEECGESRTDGSEEEVLCEEVILCEDGIFSRAERDILDGAERCAVCGYALLCGDDVMEVYETGDMIHRDCWCDYAEEAIADFGKLFEYTGDGERE